ncbi:DUF2235 domain-containing protein [Planktotalea sp.]|uniref:DUF2235 domain-containing protein n=1 Tax=Planktotalea sp. TaxID=2029877 RepID=UPI003D6BA73C
MGLSKRISLWLTGALRRRRQTPRSQAREAQTHVVVLDGTMSSLDEGYETNAGRAYKLLCEASPDLSLYYEAGVQWRGLRSAPDVMMGRGINRQIRRAYGFLASRYRTGDRIFLLGYSRGAFVARSLAGVIDQVGLLKPEHAEEQKIRTIYRIYECGDQNNELAEFANECCHDAAPIEMVGVWDTVKALGVGLPVLWRWSAPNHDFHNHDLGRSIKHGFHALARDETRNTYEPVLWTCPDDWQGRIEQVWFPGTHGDVGGQLGGFEAARPLANIPLVWMLERMESCGLVLPDNWRSRFEQNPRAASVGTWRSFGKLFLLRKRRTIVSGTCERLHHSVFSREQRQPPKRSKGLTNRLKQRLFGMRRA